MAVKRDVTHALELEERLRQAQKMEAVGRLAGGVAHDFNNILTTITGYADLLLTGLRRAGPARRERSGRSWTPPGGRPKLTRQLLTFSRKQVTSQRLISLNSVIENINSMLRPLIGEDVSLVYDLEHGLWPILADTGQIEQVILNLSVNARDAMPNGGTLTFRTRNLGLTTSRVVLTVRDTGTGMDQEVKSHLFEPFFTTKRPGAGPASVLPRSTGWWTRAMGISRWRASRAGARSSVSTSPGSRDPRRSRKTRPARWCFPGAGRRSSSSRMRSRFAP